MRTSILVGGCVSVIACPFKHFVETQQNDKQLQVGISYNIYNPALSLARRKTQLITLWNERSDVAAEVYLYLWRANFNKSYNAELYKGIFELMEDTQVLEKARERVNTERLQRAWDSRYQMCQWQKDILALLR